MGTVNPPKGGFLFLVNKSLPIIPVCDYNQYDQNDNQDKKKLDRPIERIVMVVHEFFEFAPSLADQNDGEHEKEEYEFIYKLSHGSIVAKIIEKQMQHACVFVLKNL